MTERTLTAGFEMTGGSLIGSLTSVCGAVGVAPVIPAVVLAREVVSYPGLVLRGNSVGFSLCSGSVCSVSFFSFISLAVPGVSVTSPALLLFLLGSLLG